jgi:hypothetical protein
LRDADQGVGKDAGKDLRNTASSTVGSGTTIRTSEPGSLAGYTPKAAPLNPFGPDAADPDALER